MVYDEVGSGGAIANSSAIIEATYDVLVSGGSVGNHSADVQVTYTILLIVDGVLPTQSELLTLDYTDLYSGPANRVPANPDINLESLDYSSLDSGSMGGASYSDAVVLAGSAPPSVRFDETMSGGATTNSTALVDSFYLPTGGITASGSATEQVDYNITGTAGVLGAGSATLMLVFFDQGAGGAVLAGDPFLESYYSPTGGATTNSSGVNTMTYNLVGLTDNFTPTTEEIGGLEYTDIYTGPYGIIASKSSIELGTLDYSFLETGPLGGDNSQTGIMADGSGTSGIAQLVTGGVVAAGSAVEFVQIDVTGGILANSTATNEAVYNVVGGYVLAFENCGLTLSETITLSGINDTIWAAAWDHTNGHLFTITSDGVLQKWSTGNNSLRAELQLDTLTAGDAAFKIVIDIPNDVLYLANLVEYQNPDTIFTLFKVNTNNLVVVDSETINLGFVSVHEIDSMVLDAANGFLYLAYALGDEGYKIRKHNASTLALITEVQGPDGVSYGSGAFLHNYPFDMKIDGGNLYVAGETGLEPGGSLTLAQSSWGFVDKWSLASMTLTSSYREGGIPGTPWSFFETINIDLEGKAYMFAPCYESGGVNGVGTQRVVKIDLATMTKEDDLTLPEPLARTVRRWAVAAIDLTDADHYLYIPNTHNGDFGVIVPKLAKIALSDFSVYDSITLGTNSDDLFTVHLDDGSCEIYATATFSPSKIFNLNKGYAIQVGSGNGGSAELTTPVQNEVAQGGVRGGGVADFENMGQGGAVGGGQGLLPVFEVMSGGAVVNSSAAPQLVYANIGGYTIASSNCDLVLTDSFVVSGLGVDNVWAADWDFENEYLYTISYDGVFGKWSTANHTLVATVELSPGIVDQAGYNVIVDADTALNISVVTHRHCVSGPT